MRTPLFASSRNRGPTLGRISATGIIGGGSDSWTNAHTNGRFKKYLWKDIQPTGKSIIGVALTDIITSPAHGYVNGDQVLVVSLTGGAGLSVGNYFVINRTTDTYKLSVTSGGSPVDFTTDISSGVVAKYTFSDIDEEIALANSNNKKFLLLLQLNSGEPEAEDHGNPQWLIDAGVVQYAIPNTGHPGSFVYCFLPWDTLFQQYALLAIAALCDHVDGQVAQVSMGGLGLTTEMHMPDDYPLPSPDNKTEAQAKTAYVTACNTIIAQYAAHLHTSTFTAALALPFPDEPYRSDAINEIVSTSLSLYGSAIGFENWGLNAQSSNSYLPDSIIQTRSPTNPVGFQMAGSTDGGGGNLCGSGGPPPPCLAPAMDAGVALKAQYLQVYGTDIANPDFWADFDAVTAELYPSPFAT